MGKHTRKTEQWEITSLLTVSTRRWMYGIVVALVPLLIAYGVLAEHTASLWVALAGNVLLGGTALLHTPKNAVTVGPVENPVSVSDDNAGNHVVVIDGDGNDRMVE